MIYLLIAIVPIVLIAVAGIIINDNYMTGDN